MTTPSDTLARLRARSQEAGRFVLPLDPEWAEKLTNAYRKVRTLDTEEPDPELAEQLAAAKAEVAKLEELAGDNVIVFKFRRLGKPEYEQLLKAHPITPEQRKVQEDNNVPMIARKLWNDETFEPALVHKVLIEPKLNLEEVTAMLRPQGDDTTLSMGEAQMLGQAAMAAAVSIPSDVPDELRLP